MQVWLLAGLGMFCESYFIFSIGNVGPLFTQEYPDCYADFKRCTQSLVNAQTYIQIIGIIVGMFTLGSVIDRVGRKWGSVTTASILLVGGILLVASNGSNVLGFFAMYTVAQFVFGFGVGGEYPSAASNSAEKAEASGQLSARRGEVVVCTFAMQGIGNFTNTLVLVILTVIFGQWTVPYDKHKLGAIWRTSFGIGLLVVAFVLFYRLLFVKESQVWGRERIVLQSQSKSTKVCLVRYYWHRMVGSGLSWFLIDFAFYGNRLFQSAFIKILSPHSGIGETLLWTLLNGGVAVIGYFCSAAVVDKPWMGRVRLQSLGFACISTLYLCLAAAYDSLSSPAHVHWFQALYFLSTFFTQFGPNCTTFLISGELFPTEGRSTAHGFSAGIGKCGALMAGIWFHYLSNRAKFVATTITSLLGLLITIVFVPNLMGLDLTEGDLRFHWMVIGQPEKYCGEACNPKHLSLFERWLGIGKAYNPASSHGKDVVALSVDDLKDLAGAR